MRKEAYFTVATVGVVTLMKNGNTNTGGWTTRLFGGSGFQPQFLLGGIGKVVNLVHAYGMYPLIKV